MYGLIIVLGVDLQVHRFGLKIVYI